jgi:hypothetical protein
VAIPFIGGKWSTQRKPPTVHLDQKLQRVPTEQDEASLLHTADLDEMASMYISFYNMNVTNYIITDKQCIYSKKKYTVKLAHAVTSINLNPPVCSVRDGDGVRDDDVYVVVLPMI